MNHTMFKYYLAASVAVGVGMPVAIAQEFGEASGIVEVTAEAATEGSAKEFVQETNGAMAADQSMVEQEVASEDEKSAADELADYMVKKNLTAGWDEEKERILVVEPYSFDVPDPDVSSEYIELRKENMSALLIRAKASVITKIYNEMDAERILELPPNPIADQIKADFAKFEKQLAKSKKHLERLGANLEELKAEKGKVSQSELLASIEAWFGDADKKNLAAQYDADKKELYENAKADFEKAKADHEAMLEKHEAAKESVRVSSELKTSIGLVSSMQIHGCTVLQQAERIVEKNGRYKCEMAILYSWSNERMEASNAIISGKPLKLKRGGKTIGEWLQSKRNSKALAEWIGPRSYIDSKGELWFLGIMPAACADQSSVEDRNLMAAELEARAEVNFAIYADAFTKQDLEKLRQTRDVVTENGVVDESKVYKNYSEITGERFKKLGVSGVQKFGPYKMKDASGQDINVVVMGVNASTAKTMKEVQRKMHAVAVELNTKLEIERGRQRRMREQVEASRNNPHAQRVGARQADAELQNSLNLRRQQSTKPRQAKPTSAKPTARPTRGRLQPGTRMIIDDDDE